MPSNGNNGDTYRVTIGTAPASPYLDIDATVDALTLTGGSALSVPSHSFTSAYTRIESNPFTVESPGIGVRASDAPAIANLGQLANFDAATGTLQSGSYSVSSYGSANASLIFKGARILRNTAHIFMGDRATITDELGNDALRELAVNDGLFSVKTFTALRPFTNNGELRVTGSFEAIGDFTNNGSLEMGATAATMVVAGKLTNFNPVTKTLTGGRFAIYDNAIGRLQFPAANIVTNSADLSLAFDGTSGPLIADEKGADALRNLATNTADGRITIGYGDFATTAAHFTNAGYLSTTGKFTLPAGGVFEQVGGALNVSGYYSALDTRGGSIILSGGVVGGGLFKGNTASNTLIKPRIGQYTAPMTIEGNLTLGSASILQFDLRGTTRPYALPPNPRGGLPPVNSYDAIDCTGSVVIDGQIQLGLGQYFSATRFAPGPNDTFVVVKSQAPISGSFTNAANGQRLATSDGSGSFKVNYGPTSAFDPTAVVLSEFQANNAPDLLLNISSRGFVGNGDRAMIGGFIITGSQPKRVIVRAIGPSLQAYVSTPLDDPTLSLHDSTGTTIAANDDWMQSSQRTEIERTGIPPIDGRESAIIATLAPGAYTAVVAAKNDRTGIGLVEIYDLDVNSDSQLANISTRGSSSTGSSGDSSLIGGVIIGGGSTPSKIVVRALGPSLTANGVTGALPDPILYLESRNGPTYTNDSWKTNQVQVEATGLAPRDDREAVIIQNLAPGAHTASVRPASGSSGGVALVEFYRLK